MFQASDGVALHVEDSADASAPVTVLLTHGWTSDNRVWDAVAPRIPHRVIRFDHRGHGSSGHGEATLERLGDDLAELIAAAVPEGRLVLVGHSMGGMAMMALAARHPDLVRSRVHAAFFVSTSSGRMAEITFGLPRPLVKAAMALRKRLGRPRRPASAATAPQHPRRSAPAETAPHRPAPAETAPHRPAPAEAAVASAPKPPRRPSPLQARAQLAFLRWLLFGARYDRADLLSVADQLRVVHRRSAAALRSSINRHAAAEALRVYRDVPTQILTGQRDRLIPAEHSRAIAAELPDAELVVYPNAGHMLPYERVDDLVARVLAAV
ncbi:alpha/beta fold hydrolase [Actinokineospora sp. UTMC 2448]|uniref:alpha/beta fold hydrolase n=1 Tax=Actinokineospora sp. UTMC 2448 TaxID=2268449 RepID=UPI00216489AB|nr:alpha/beta hydrolase [Actinokineospora sp. UTMC 2448]UVS77184.1 N-acyl homoserine lactonase [Actinokineospora sp. UTMC 2448]